MTKARVIVDADSCPKTCLQITRKLARTYDFIVITIASFNHRIDNINHRITGDEAQATDIAIMNQLLKGDIVITQDWGLAAMVLGKKDTFAIAPNGRIYENSRMDSLLEERHTLAKFRRGGGRTRGPSKWTPEDGHRFERNFIVVLKRAFSVIAPISAHNGGGQ